MFYWGEVVKLGEIVGSFLDVKSIAGKRGKISQESEID